MCNKFGKTYVKTDWKGLYDFMIGKEILIEELSKTYYGYRLYGTNIPVIFYSTTANESFHPNFEICIGVQTRQWTCPSTEERFRYHGRRITDYDIINWLNDANNIESMKKIRDYAMAYPDECNKNKQKLIEQELRKQILSELINQELERRITPDLIARELESRFPKELHNQVTSTLLDEELVVSEGKNVELLGKSKELVLRYNQNDSI